MHPNKFDLSANVQTARLVVTQLREADELAESGSYSAGYLLRWAAREDRLREQAAIAQGDLDDRGAILRDFR
jgi:hypothetical protein